MIEHSVGNGGFNDHNDTLIIQCALNVARVRTGLTPIAIDGFIGPETIGAILAFQRANAGLANDGRIDPGGRTIAALTSFIGGEEHVFGPIIEQVMAIKQDIDQLLSFGPQNATQPLLRIMPGLTEINQNGDLAEGAPSIKSPGVKGFNRGAPAFGFVGVDDAIAAATLAMMALIMALLLVLIIQSPAFRKAVSVRAKELDRIMRDLKINASVGLQESVDIVTAIFTDSKEMEQRCRQSPTFQETAECAEAIRLFVIAVANVQALLPRLTALLFTILNFKNAPHSGIDIFKTRAVFDKLLADAQAAAFELQLALSDMRQNCKCPDEA